MREDARIYVVVGVFVIAMVVSLIVWITLVSGRTGATDSYRIVYDNVLGLKTGVEILYEGYPVGHIESIRPIDRDGRRRYELEVSVQHGWPVPDDSVATIRAPGLLAAFVIDIRGGESTRPLPPGSEIVGVGATDVLETVNKLAGGVDGILEQSVRPLLESIAEGVPRVLTSADDIAAELRQAAANVSAMLSDANVDRVSNVLGNLESTSGGLDTLIADLAGTRGQLDGVVAKMNLLMDRETGELHAAIAELNYTLQAVSRHIDAITINLETTSRNAGEFSRQIRDDPSVLLRGREGAEEQ